MRNIVILNSLHFSYPLPILMRVSYNTLIVKQNTSDYYKYRKIFQERTSPYMGIIRLSTVFQAILWLRCFLGAKKLEIEIFLYLCDIHPNYYTYYEKFS